MSANDPLVEVVARAQYARDVEDEERPEWDAPNLAPIIRHVYVEDARAVLAAITETGRLLPESDRSQVSDSREGEGRRMTEPRTWSLPPEPGPEVKAVRDADGDVWLHNPEGWHCHDLRCVEGCKTVPGGVDWVDVLRWSPLTDATADVT